MAMMDWYYKVAFMLNRLWAGQGTSEAQFNLGYLYFIGKGVAQDHAEAARWYRKAANQGFLIAQFNLGHSCEKGLGVPQDDVQAHMWFDLAASRSSRWKEMQEAAANARDAVASRMTPAQVAEAKKLAGEWKPKKEL